MVARPLMRRILTPAIVEMARRPFVGYTSRARRTYNQGYPLEQEIPHSSAHRHRRHRRRLRHRRRVPRAEAGRLLPAGLGPHHRPVRRQERQGRRPGARRHHQARRRRRALHHRGPHRQGRHRQGALQRPDAQHVRRRRRRRGHRQVRRPTARSSPPTSCRPSARASTRDQASPAAQRPGSEVRACDRPRQHTRSTLALVFSLASVVFLALGMRWDRKDLIRNGYYAVYGFFLDHRRRRRRCCCRRSSRRTSASATWPRTRTPRCRSSTASPGSGPGSRARSCSGCCCSPIAAIVIAVIDLNRVERLTGGAVVVLGVVCAVFAALMVLDAGSNPFVAAEAGAHAVRPQPAAAAPGHGAAPAGAVHRLRRPRRAVRLRHLHAAARAAATSSGCSARRSGPCSAGSSSRSASASAPGGPTWCSASAATGPGTRWRTPRSCPGSRPPRCSTPSRSTRRAASSSAGRWASPPLTFFFTILATWTTRTGLISSVHAFGRNPVLIWILSTFLVVTAVGSAGAHRLALAPLREPRRGRERALARLPLLRHQPAAHAVRRGRRLRHGRRAAAHGAHGRGEHLRRHRPSAGRRHPRPDRRLPAARLAQDRGRAAAQDAHPAAGDHARSRCRCGCTSASSPTCGASSACSSAASPSAPSSSSCCARRGGRPDPARASGPAWAAPSPAAARAPPPTSCTWAWCSSSPACSAPPCTRSSRRPSSRSSPARRRASTATRSPTRA